MTDFSRYSMIKVDREDDILILTLNRPERLNAVTGEMHTELAHIFMDADRDEQSNVVVITGEGRAFCAGGDVGGMTSEAGSNLIQHGVRVRGEAHQIVEGILGVEKPVIAMVNGPAVGLGATIALLCDVVVAADDARIGDTHVKVGLVAGDGGAVIWPLLIGVNRAKEFLMTGDLITGKDAAAIGLVNHAVPREELRQFTMSIARKLGDQMPYAVRATKVAVNRMLRRQVLEMMDACLGWEDLSMKMADHREAAAAFKERRRPSFVGR